VSFSEGRRSGSAAAESAHFLVEETEQTAGRPLPQKNAGVSQTAALKKNTTLYLYATLYCA
jgi:hypothetical protein